MTSADRIKDLEDVLRWIVVAARFPEPGTTPLDAIVECGNLAAYALNPEAVEWPIPPRWRAS